VKCLVLTARQPDIWATVEFTTAIIVAALPSLRPLLRSFSRHLTSKGTNANQRSTGRDLGSSAAPPTVGSNSFSRWLWHDSHTHTLSSIHSVAVDPTGSDTALNLPEEGEIHKMDRISVRPYVPKIPECRKM